MAEIEKLSMAYYQNNPNDKESLYWFIENKWCYWSDEDPIKEYHKHLDRLKNPIKGNHDKKFVLITIQDFQTRLEDIEKLEQFIKRIAYMYNAGFWVIESGKADPPNVHIHLFVQIKNSKKHKAQLNIHWMKLFKTNLQGKNDYYHIKQWRDTPDMPSYDNWCKEKIDYFTNENKGTHANVVDLNLRGEF